MPTLANYLNELSGINRRVLCCVAVVFWQNEERFDLIPLSVQKLHDSYGADLADEIVAIEDKNYKCLIYFAGRKSVNYRLTISLVAGAMFEHAITGRKLDNTVCGEYLGIETIPLN